MRGHAWMLGLALGVSLLGLTVLTGCNTVKGVGQDFQESADTVHGWMYQGDPAPLPENQYQPQPVARTATR